MRDDGWQSTPPDRPGTWLMSCNETPEPDPIPVYFKRGELWCDSGAGSMPVQMLHDGLTAIVWREASESA